MIPSTFSCPATRWCSNCRSPGARWTRCATSTTSSIFRYFETARIAYLGRVGWPDGGVGIILASVQARFRKALTYPDRILVAVRVAKLAEDRFTMEHVVYSRQHRAVATEGHGVVVTYDYQAQRKTAVPAEMRRRILEMEAAADHQIDEAAT